VLGWVEDGRNQYPSFNKPEEVAKQNGLLFEFWKNYRKKRKTRKSNFS